MQKPLTRNKTAVEAGARRKVAEVGGTFLKINWSKMTMHYLTRTGHKRVGVIYLSL